MCDLTWLALIKETTAKQQAVQHCGKQRFCKPLTHTFLFFFFFLHMMVCLARISFHVCQQQGCCRMSRMASLFPKNSLCHTWKMECSFCLLCHDGGPCGRSSMNQSYKSSAKPFPCHNITTVDPTPRLSSARTPSEVPQVAHNHTQCLHWIEDHHCGSAAAYTGGRPMT